MLTNQDIVNRLKSRIMNLYKVKVNELRELKESPGDSLIKHQETCLKASEMLGVAECLNIINEFERYYRRDLK